MLKINLLNLIKKHISLGIMTLGSVCMFGANLILREVFSEVDYGVYSLVITYISLISSFGLLGLEQVFLRISSTSQNTISTSRYLVNAILLVFLILSPIFGIIFHYLFAQMLSVLVCIFITMGASFTMFSYNLFRLNRDFTASQLISNFWKICLGFMAAVLWLKFTVDIQELVYALIIFLGISGIFTFIGASRRYKLKMSLKNNRKEIRRFSAQFFIALMGLALISYADKFFIEQRFGLAQLGQYFYLATLFIFPFSLFQNYIGFKELVRFKENYSKELLVKKLQRTSIFWLILTTILVLMACLISWLNLTDVDFKNAFGLIAVFLAIGFIKLNYGLFSAVIGALATVQLIKKLNGYVLILSAIVAVISYYLINNLVDVAITVLIFWVIRGGVYWFMINKSIN